MRRRIVKAACIVLAVLSSCHKHAPRTDAADTPTRGRAASEGRDVIEGLARDIRGGEPDEVRATIVRRLGEPDRDVGSGLRIDEWDVGGGVLTFHPCTGPVFTCDGRTTRLIRTNNLAEECLFGEYEVTTPPDPANHGTRFWVGNVTLSPDGPYRYEESHPSPTLGGNRDGGFFSAYPNGSARVQYAEGVTPKTRLEDLPDGTRIATVTLASADGSVSATFDIVSYRSRTMLEAEGPGDIPFLMYRLWVNCWR